MVYGWLRITNNNLPSYSFYINVQNDLWTISLELIIVTFASGTGKTAVINASVMNNESKYYKQDVVLNVISSSY